MIAGTIGMTSEWTDCEMRGVGVDEGVRFGRVKKCREMELGDYILTLQEWVQKMALSTLSPKIRAGQEHGWEKSSHRCPCSIDKEWNSAKEVQATCVQIKKQNHKGNNVWITAGAMWTLEQWFTCKGFHPLVLGPLLGQSELFHWQCLYLNWAGSKNKITELNNWGCR